MSFYKLPLEDLAFYNDIELLFNDIYKPPERLIKIMRAIIENKFNKEDYINEIKNQNKYSIIFSDFYNSENTYEVEQTDKLIHFILFNYQNFDKFSSLFSVNKTIYTIVIDLNDFKNVYDKFMSYKENGLIHNIGIIGYLLLFNKVVIRIYSSQLNKLGNEFKVLNTDLLNYIKMVSVVIKRIYEILEVESKGLQIKDSEVIAKKMKNNKEALHCLNNLGLKLK